MNLGILLLAGLNVVAYSGTISSVHSLDSSSAQTGRTYNVYVGTTVGEDTQKKYTGTNDDVYINIFGTGGETGYLYLDNELDNFENGQFDSFSVNGPDIGILIGVNLKKDGSDDWSVSYVAVDGHEMDIGGAVGMWVDGNGIRLFTIDDLEEDLYDGSSVSKGTFLAVTISSGVIILGLLGVIIFSSIKNKKKEKAEDE